MSKGITKFGVVSFVLALLAPLGIANAAGEAVSSHMDAYLVVKTADGKEALEPAKAVKPGAVIEYQITYENSDASKPVSDLKINTPVPTGTSYIDGSAKTAVTSQIRFSADAGKSWQPPAHRRARRHSGQQQLCCDSAGCWQPGAVPGLWCRWRWHDGQHHHDGDQYADLF